MSYYDASNEFEFSMLAMVLGHLLEHASGYDVEIMLVGAAARDLLIRNATGALPQRATADVDIAVAVANWADYARLTAGLAPVGKSRHKFRVEGVEVDVIPFGGVESADRTITWPNESVMNTIGFREALGCAVAVKLPGNVTVKVASLPAQTVLKLHAWRDRRQFTTRDAIDLRSILTAYSNGPHLEELYTEWEQVLSHYDFDPELAGAHRVGSEIRQTLGAAMADECCQIIGEEAEGNDRLAAEMAGTVRRNRLLLNATRAGAGAGL